MSAIKTVALAGASGSLGAPILKALIDANFTVTVLIRAESSQTYASTVKTSKVDYNDTATLVSALQGQDAVISAVGFAAFDGQEALIDAAITAGVQRILPSEWGADPRVSAARQLPVFAGKVKTEQYVKSKTQGTSTSYTLVCNNVFLDWDLDHNFGVDIKGKKIEIFDGGNVVFTSTPMDFVARGVVAVLQHPDETANRTVLLHGAALTQNKLLERIQRFVGNEGWQISHASTADRKKQGYENLKIDPSNFMAWGVPFLQVSIWGEEYGGDFSTKNDNELLGLKELTDAELDNIVRVRT